MPSPEKFKETLIRYNIESHIIEKINADYEDLVSSSPIIKKREYFKRAMNVFDMEVPRDIVVDLMDDNGCGKDHTAREKSSLKFAKNNFDKTIEERIPLISNERNMGVPRLTEDGKLYILAVQYARNDQFRCACPNINTKRKKEEALSRTYCICCAGHFRYHYQIMLDCELKLDCVLTSPLDSDGQEPCSFVFQINDAISDEKTT